MAPDMHSNGVALPKPPPGATAVRVKPHVGGVAVSDGPDAIQQH